MKPLAIFIAFVFLLPAALAADMTVTNESEAAQQEQLFQRFLKEMRKAQFEAPTNTDVSYLTNLDTPTFREYFKRMVVDPSFGYRWDEVPAPTMTGSNAMAAVNAFVATNGWDMQKDGGVFCVAFPDKSKPMRGLPWTVIHNREFRAVTYNGILYVFFTGFHDDSSGVAYNPNTNTFTTGIDGFKPIGQHWYVWIQPEEYVKLAQEYEGAKK